METALATGTERMQAIADEWRLLLACSGQNEPTLTPEWMVAWCEEFGGRDGREVRLLEMRDGPRLVGLAPLVARRRRHRGLIPLRRLELACSGEPVEDEVLSEYIGILAARGCEAAVAASFVDAVRRGRLGPVHEFFIPAMSSEDPLAEPLAAEFRRSGWRATLTATAVAPYASLPATWEAYLASLSSSRRYTVRRAEREFNEWAEGAAVLRVARTEQELERGRRILESLHGQRWEAAGRRGAFASAAFARFHSRVMPVLFRSGMLELLWLEAKGEPAAVLYNLVWRSKVYNYQSGRRMDLPGSLRPGYAIHAAALRRAIELGRREYDFLGGGRRYKHDFSVASRSLVELQAVRPGPHGLACRLVDLLAAATRRLENSRRSSAVSSAAGGPE